MKVLFTGSECIPFAKTGGLADVLGELPQAMASRSVPASVGELLSSRVFGPPPTKSKKVEVITVLPLYSQIDRKKFPVEKIPGKIFVAIGDRVEEGAVYALQLPPGKKAVSHRVYFIHQPKYFDRPELYRDAEKDFDDNDERFIFFSKAVLELAKLIDFKPDIIHCHDWQTALIPAYLKTLYRIDAFFHRTASVFTIHNIAYQGLFSKHSLFLAGFSWHDFTPDKLEYYDQFNFLKSGLVYADKITTVSPTYAKEVQGQWGRGMEGILKTRAKDFVGILNGLEKNEWNPSKDPITAAKFSKKSKDLVQKKSLCKAELQKTVGLPEDASVPLIGMVTRLDPQKGVHRLGEIVPQLCENQMPFQWIVLGSGDKNISDILKSLAKKYPEQFAFESGFNNDLAHKIYAGSDLFFMPSEFEPCGLSQIISMRYGTVPIVTPTGGLQDTVIRFDPQTGTGTGFVAAEISNPALTAAILKAFEVYEDRAAWNQCVANAMAGNFSWEVSAQSYLDLYEEALKSKLP